MQDWLWHKQMQLQENSKDLWTWLQVHKLLEFRQQLSSGRGCVYPEVTEQCSSDEEMVETDTDEMMYDEETEEIMRSVFGADSDSEDGLP